MKKKSIKLSTLRKKLGKFLDVRNMETVNGTIVPNQFILTFENGTMFQSYKTVIGVKYDGSCYLSPKHDYSQVTNRFSKQFCSGLTKKQRNDALNNGWFVTIVED